MASDLTPEENAALRARMRRVRNERFGENTTKLAEALDALGKRNAIGTMSQPSLSSILNGRGASVKTAKMFALLVGLTLADVLTAEPADVAASASDEPAPDDNGIDRRLQIAMAAQLLGYPHWAVTQVLGSSFKGGDNLTNEDLLSMIRDAVQESKGKSLPEPEMQEPAESPAKKRAREARHGAAAKAATDPPPMPPGPKKGRKAK